jgi:hypothetical protein
MVPVSHCLYDQSFITLVQHLNKGPAIVIHSGLHIKKRVKPILGRTITAATCLRPTIESSNSIPLLVNTRKTRQPWVHYRHQTTKLSSWYVNVNICTTVANIVLHQTIHCHKRLAAAVCCKLCSHHTIKSACASSQYYPTQTSSCQARLAAMVCCKPPSRKHE